MKKYVMYVRFLIVALIAHVLGYLIAGGIAYQLITKEFWEGTNSILSVYLRTPGNVELWKHAMTWQIPGQFFRAIFIAIALFPLLESIKLWKLRKLILFYFVLIFVLTHFASAAPSPANIEGLIYMKPELITPGFLKMQPEMILYSIIFAIILGKYGIKKIKE